MAIPLRADHSAEQLRSTARASKDAAQARRSLALAVIYEGASRTEAAQIGAATVQIVRHWAWLARRFRRRSRWKASEGVKFNAQGPAGLIDRKPPVARGAEHVRAVGALPARDAGCLDGHLAHRLRLKAHGDHSTRERTAYHPSDGVGSQFADST